MSVVHNHPHPMAGKDVLPTNMQIHAKFGAVRVVDWDDRVAGETWMVRENRGNSPEAAAYPNLMIEIGQFSARIPPNDVVRCHSLRTGELILLHDDWLPKAA